MKCGLFSIAGTHHVNQRFSVYMPPHPLHELTFTVVLKAFCPRKRNYSMLNVHISFQIIKSKYANC